LQAAALAILRQLWGGQVSQVHPRYQKDLAVPSNDNQLENNTMREKDDQLDQVWGH
jgi:hypothetical protein